MPRGCGSSVKHGRSPHTLSRGLVGSTAMLKQDKRKKGEPRGLSSAVDTGPPSYSAGTCERQRELRHLEPSCCLQSWVTNTHGNQPPAKLCSEGSPEEAAHRAGRSSPGPSQRGVRGSGSQPRPPSVQHTPVTQTVLTRRLCTACNICIHPPAHPAMVSWQEQGVLCSLSVILLSIGSLPVPCPPLRSRGQDHHHPVASVCLSANEVHHASCTCLSGLRWATREGTCLDRALRTLLL